MKILPRHINSACSKIYIRALIMNGNFNFSRQPFIFGLIKINLIEKNM